MKIGFFRSESDLAYHDTLYGDLFTQVAKTIDLVRTKYLKAAITFQGIQRIERYPVPDAALREAILNALVHRDHAVGAPVLIRVHEDRLRIWNPCVLPDGWTVKHFSGRTPRHRSTPPSPMFSSAPVKLKREGVASSASSLLARKREHPNPSSPSMEPASPWSSATRRNI